MAKMLQNAYFLAKIGADTAENEQHLAEILPKTGNYPTGPHVAVPVDAAAASAGGSPETKSSAGIATIGGDAGDLRRRPSGLIKFGPKNWRNAAGSKLYRHRFSNRTCILQHYLRSTT